MTAIAEQLSKLGMEPADYAFAARVLEFARKGKTIERAIDIVRSVYAKFPEVDPMPMPRGQRTSSASGKPLEEADGHRECANTAKISVPSASSSPSERGGQLKSASSKAQRAVPPAREPSVHQRSIAASNAKVAAITIMDTLKIDGLAIGNWTIARARVEGQRKTREGYILREAAHHVANASPNAKIRDVVRIAALQVIMQKAAETADAV